MRKISVSVIVILALAILLAAACSPAKKAPAGAQKPTAVPKTEIPTTSVQGSAARPEVPLSVGQGETTTTLPPGAGTSGTGTTPGGVQGPADWPKDIPIMPGLNGVSTNTAGIFVFNASGKMKPDEVRKFYQSLEGWTKKKPAASQSKQNPLAFAMEKDGRTLEVMITDEKGTTRVQLMHMPKR